MLGAEAYATRSPSTAGSVGRRAPPREAYEVDTQGTHSSCVRPAPERARAAAARHGVLSAVPIRMRVGIHTGDPARRPTKVRGHGRAPRRADRWRRPTEGRWCCRRVDALRSSIRTFELIDLGEHRLKDIEKAIPIYQLGDGAFPPLKTISNTNLPRPANSFVGRELSSRRSCEASWTERVLVTLTGPGGTGKTRFALEAPAEHARVQGGVFWVGLGVTARPGARRWRRSRRRSGPRTVSQSTSRERQCSSSSTTWSR